MSDAELHTRALDVALAPIRHLMAFGEDVAVNEPGRVWHYHQGHWQEHLIPEMTERRCRWLARLAEAQNRPERRSPIISTDIRHTGHRGEFILPPGTLQGSVVMCFRRADEGVAAVETMTTRFNTARWNKWGQRHEAAQPGMSELLALYDSGDVVAFYRKFADMRLNVVFCADTGAGKTDQLKTFLSLLDDDVRMVMIEDAKEAVVFQKNVVRLTFNNAAGVTAGMLLAAAMRLRPHVVPVQELRTPEVAYVYVDQASTGHRGSPTTVHGRTAGQAARRMFNLIKGAPECQGKDDATVAEDIANAVDMIVPLENIRGARFIAEVWFAADRKRRGETFLDLLRDG